MQESNPTKPTFAYHDESSKGVPEKNRNNTRHDMGERIAD
jgi:hypothetical protein